MIIFEKKNCNTILQKISKNISIIKKNWYIWISYRLTGGEILPPNQRRVVERAKFNYSPLGEALENQRKTIEDQGESK